MVASWGLEATGPDGCAQEKRRRPQLHVPVEQFADLAAEDDTAAVDSVAAMLTGLATPPE